ncbi:MAG: hypothetical protein U5P41_15360 [Gammaproteobacteria bacterium]|nr:hypothetical protein [Gammaproteobacteria bacterium]
MKKVTAMRREMLFSLALGLMFAAPITVQAGDVVDEIVKETARKVFSETERRTIRDYYGDSHGGPRDKGRGPGRHGKLPPGLQMQLEKNGRLPPGLEKKALPPGLAGQLPPTPKGYERVIVDSDVVLIHTASQMIADVISDVVLDH